MQKTILAVLAATTACLLALVPTAAGDEPPAGLEMEARAAFDGYFKYGEWLPVWVALENSGADLEAELQVHLAGSGGTTVFAAPAPLPGGSRKRIPLYVLPNNYSHELEIQLVAGDRVLQRRTVTVQPQINLTYLVGLVAAERGALSLLSGAALPGQNRPMQLVDLALSDLPDRPEGLASFDCLIFNDVDTSPLTPEQRAALRAWVGKGGRLVVGGGAGAQRTAAGLGESLLPLVPQGDVALEAVPSLVSLAGATAIRVPGPFVVAHGQPLAGEVLAQEGDLALVRERAEGEGYVDWVALDLAASPFDGWAGTTAFWERLLAPGAAYPPWLASDVSTRQMQAGQLTYALSNLPALDLPSVQGLALLLTAYVLAVGPLNYLFLRWRRRLHWAWVTVPLLTVVFSAGAFGLGYTLRGSDLIVHKIALLDLSGNGTAHVRSYIGLFSPSQRTYEVNLEGSPLLSSLSRDYDPWGRGGTVTGGEMVLVQGHPASVRGLAVDQWSLQGLLAEETRPGAGHMVADLQLEGQSLRGTVRNETGYALADAVLILGSQFARLGDLAPGETAGINLDLAGLGSQAVGPPLSYRLFEAEFSQAGRNGPSRKAQLRQLIVDNLLQQGGMPGSPALSWEGGSLQGPLLIGWLDEAPPQVSVAGRRPTQDTTGLVHARLSYRLPPEGSVSVPAGLVPGTLIETPVEGGLCGPPGKTAVYVGRGQAIFEFQVPGAGQWQVDQLDLSLSSDGGWAQSPALAVYDWQAATWQEVEGAVMGNNAVAPVGNLVGADGRVRVRLAFPQGSGSCSYVELGVQGTRAPADEEPGS